MSAHDNGRPPDGDGRPPARANGTNGSERPAGSGYIKNTASTPLTMLYEHTGRDGFRYLVGKLGSARITILQTEERNYGRRIWHAVLTPGPSPNPVATDLAQRIDDDEVAFLGPPTTA